MPTAAYGSLPFAEQAEFFRRKLNLPTDGWTDIYTREHDWAFVVAGANRDAIVADFRAAVEKAIAGESTLEDFRKDFDRIVATHGWDYNGGRNWRSRVIYDTRPGLQGIANRIIRLRLRSIYSHNEVVFEPQDGVGHLMPDGTCEPGADGSLWCASSVAAEALPEHSPRRQGKTGGVRFKRIALDPSHWDVRRVACNPIQAAQWFKAHEGELYDWQLILGFVSWVIPHKSQRWTCSESCAAALGVPEDDAWRFDPANLHTAAGAWM